VGSGKMAVARGRGRVGTSKGGRQEWEGRWTRVNGEGRQGRERDRGLEETSIVVSVE
jgi:hypothetical protein